MNPLGAPIINGIRFAATLVLPLLIAINANTHQSGGTFDHTKTIELTGKLTRLELINPHSWIYFVDYSKSTANRK